MVDGHDKWWISPPDFYTSVGGLPKIIKKEPNSMNNIFLISPSKKIMDVLIKAGFETSPFTDKGKSGILIHADESTVSEVLSIHLSKNEAMNISNTDMDGVVACTITKKSKKKKAVKEGLNVSVNGEWFGGFQKQNFIKTTIDILLPVVKKNIILQSMDGRPINPPQDKKHFYIFFYSTLPEGTDQTLCPNRVFGVPPRVDYMYTTSKKGIAIKDWITGSEVAEIVDNVLYIHYELTGGSKSGKVAMYENILNEYILQFHTPPAKKKRLEESRHKEKFKKARSKSNYVGMVAKGKENTIKEIKSSLERLESEITQFQKNMISLMRKSNEKRDIIISLKSGESRYLKTAQREYEKTLAAPKVAGISLDNGILIVHTDILYCEDPRTGIIHEIGKFNIHILVDSKAESTPNPERLISFYNLSRRVQAYGKKMNAPHVFSGGNPCLGNLSEVMSQQIANYQFSVLILLAIQFIENVNVDDSAGKYINKWPVAKHSKVQVKDLSNEQRVTQSGFRMYPAIPDGPEKITKKKQSSLLTTSMSTLTSATNGF